MYCLLNRLVDHCYTGELRIDARNVQDLLAASHFLNMSQVLDASCNFMEEHMDAANCLMARGFAELHDCLDLAEKARSMALEQFPLVSESEEFLELSHVKVTFCFGL